MKPATPLRCSPFRFALDDCFAAFVAREVADPMTASNQAFREACGIIDLNWAAVLVLAAALQERRSLTSRQTLRLIKDAGQSIVPNE
jgi:hypothetical protein